MKYSVTEICKASGTEAEGLDASAVPVGWSIDTRTIKPGEVYYSIVGENHDGHAFAADALSKGALAAVVRRDYRLPEGTEGALLRCDDPLDALHRLASHSREESGLHLAGITGSCGKTTTKDFAAAMLSRELKTGRNRGNLNNIWGLPLEILRRDPDLDLYVCEMGMSYAGELSVLTRIARPDVVVLTNIHGVHLMNFKSVREIAEAKAEILEGLAADGPLVANADDPEVMRVAVRSGHPLVTFGIDEEADIRAAMIVDSGLDGLSFELRTPEGLLGVRSSLPGRHNMLNLLAAFALGYALGYEPADLLDGLADLEMSPARTRIVEMGDGWTLYDDTYNSNPRALGLTIETVMSSEGHARRIAVLGDMLELGPGEVEQHRESGRMLGAAGLDALITLGPLAGRMAEAAVEAGMNGKSVIALESKDDLLEALEGMLRPGDLVLIKGSRGVKMETIVAELTRRHGVEREPEDGERK